MFPTAPRIRWSSLDGNRFECSHEGPGPWPTSRGTKYHLARSVDEASDEVLPEGTGHNHRFTRCDLSKVAQLTDEVMGKDYMGEPGSVDM